MKIVVLLERKGEKVEAIGAWPQYRMDLAEWELDEALNRGRDCWLQLVPWY
jgi:hypothetical protein